MIHGDDRKSRVTLSLEYRSRIGVPSCNTGCIQSAFCAPDRCPPVRNSRISLLFAPVSRPISLSRDHIELTATRRRHDNDARRKPVPAKNVNGISASPVNLFSSYCCARQKTGSGRHAFSRVCSSRSRHRSACVMLPKNHARCIEAMYRMYVYRSRAEGILSLLHLLHVCIYIY